MRSPQEMRNLTENPTVRRLVSCLFGGFVLALMYGDQEGSQNDFGASFATATEFPRLLIFLVIGLALFVVITFWPQVAPYVHRPGVVGLGAGFLTIAVALALLNWYDPVGKFGQLSDVVARTSSIGAVASAYFAWLAYTLWLVSFVLGAAAVILARAVLGWVLTGLAVVSAVLSWVAHSQVLNAGGGIDHSLGMYVAVVGYVIYAGAGVVIARAQTEVAAPRKSIDKALAWRPGFPFVVIAAVLLIMAFAVASWFAPLELNLAFSNTADTFTGTGIAQFALAYFNWLGYALAATGVILGLVATLRGMRPVAWVTFAVGFVGLLATFLSLRDITDTGYKAAPQYGREWSNLGVGGWVACIAFSMLMLGGYLSATDGKPLVRRGKDRKIADLPLHKGAERTATSSLAKSIVPIALVIALFYPPTLPLDWQTTIVTQIGPYLLLAVGLNVVVGWAGLLDLGYIAFYGIGSYTTAYITGSLPVKPPSWLHLSPLWAIPFAIVACLIAGVILGVPTLRLRGDYLAIVTLGFGEIIQIVAINNPGNLTGGPQGPNVPNPVLNLGFFSIHWGLDELPYWYLLLVFLIVMVILFYRLEGSRLGRAWAAIREDEVAAQATGINTTRVKLLAFAIGASTSGLAGVFFATQVGYFDPTLFTLQNSILIVAYVVFGGMGSLTGAIAGAAVLTWLPVFLKSQVPQADAQMWIGAIVLLMMIFRPAGLFPARRRAAELEGLDAPASSEVTAVPASEGI